MADITIKYTENMVGAGHPSLADTLNRFMLVEHEVDGTHNLSIDISFVDIRGQLPDGYVSDGSVVYRTQIKAAADKAEANGIPLFIPPGTWNTDVVLRTTAEIFGLTPNKCILYNSGIGDALDLGGASYYNHYSGFQVKGNVSSRDVITLYTTAGDNPGYMQFDAVYSTYHGRHGLYHRNAWGTKYRGCKFHYNKGLGAYLLTTTGDPGTHNGVSFLQSEFRWNGGTAAATTYADLKGGISINGGTCVTFDDACIIESNNAWQIMTGHDTYQSLQVVNILNSYIEGRPTGSATVGGTFYFKYGGKIRVEGCEIGFGAGVGNTSYAYYIDGAVQVNEENNQYSGGGGGTSLYINAGAKLGRTIKPVVTTQMGDLGAGGAPIAQTLLTASNDGEYKITGTIHCGRNSEQGESFPFIATRYQSSRSASVGYAITGTRGFGARDTTKVKNTNYLSATDLIISAYAVVESGFVFVEGYSDATATPTTLITKSSISVVGYIVNITFTVKKGDYWRVDFAGAGSANIKTTPVGTVELTTVAPTIAWSGNNLQVTWGAYHVGYVEFSYTQASMPTTFTLNSAYLIRNDELANLPF